MKLSALSSRCFGEFKLNGLNDELTARAVAVDCD